MKNKELKLFVGGYYDDRIFEGDYFDGKTPFGKDIKTYTLSEALQLEFVDGVINCYNEYRADDEPSWDDTTDEQKAQAILQYLEGDDMAGLVYFDTEEAAEKYKNDCLKDIEECESESVFSHYEEDRNRLGVYRPVYVLK